MKRLLFPLGFVALAACNEKFPRALATTDDTAVSNRVGLDARPVSATCRAGPRPTGAPPLVAFERVSAATFEMPVDIVRHDGILYVLEQAGRMYRIDGDTKSLVLDVAAKIVAGGEAGLLGVAFHPRFRDNGFVYLHCNVPYPTTPKPDDVVFQSAIVRYRSNDGGRTLDPASEKRIATVDQPFSNHNGGSIGFGNDGLLYWALGDGGAGGDPLGNAQNKDSLLGKILRLDVDGGDPYAIPGTNPFAAGGGRGEIYAYGLRNPFRFRFDEIEGTLWVGDVGQGAREEIDKVVLGGNYGWNVREGKICYPETATCSATGLLDPIVDHGREDANAITGGVVYRGSGIPRLAGTYVYGDFGSGRLWSIPIDQDAPTPLRVFDGTNDVIRPSAFAIDAGGELVLTDWLGGRVLRMVPGPAEPPEMPERLSLTGCVDRTDSKLPAAGLFPYDVLSPQWADGASAERHLAVPEGAVARSGPDGRLAFPTGSVVMKTFLAEGRRLETQLLLARPGAEAWDAYTYVWDENQMDATLAPNGARVRLASGREHVVVARSDCASCHGGAPLGLEAAQLDRDDVDYGARRGNPLVTLESLRMIEAPVPRERYRPLAAPDGFETTSRRATSYLHANCAFCHRGGENALDLRIGFDACKQRWIVPGAPETSVLVGTMAKTGEGRMPPLGTAVPDARAVTLVSRWVRELRCP